MRFIITALLVSFLSSTGFSQDLKFLVRNSAERTVTKGKLDSAKTMSDIKTGYPSSWITDYVSAEISLTCNGKIMTGASINDTLNATQISLLNMADLGTDVIIDVKYNYKNAATNNTEINDIHFSLRIVPEIEAEYIGGSEQMSQYFKETVISKIPETESKDFPGATIRFTVNEDGKTVNAKVYKTSGNPRTDNLLLEAINNMPRWKPAENSQGIKVKQGFEFLVLSAMDGC